MLDREKTRLLEIQATLRSQLGEFEKRYSMTTADFYVRFQRGELGDDMDFMEWAATSDMLKSTEKHWERMKGRWSVQCYVPTLERRNEKKVPKSGQGEWADLDALE